MTSTPARPDAPAPITLTTPEDVLAAVPVVLGFHPEDSVVMLTFGAAGSSRTFHARTCMPPTRADDEEVVSSLLDPARRHRVRAVLLVLYSADADAVQRVTRRITRAFELEGIEVLDALRVHDRRWYAATGRRPGVPSWGVPYDVSSHPFLAQSVLEGKVTLGSRTELEASLATDETRVARLAAALRAVEEGGWFSYDDVRSAVSLRLEEGTFPDDELAAVLLALQVPEVRDAAWTHITRADAREHVGLWTDAVRRSPRDLLPGVAAVLAFAAWMSGQGALAWCAVDRCLQVAPADTLSLRVADLLQHAVSPRMWDGGGSQDR